LIADENRRGDDSRVPTTQEVHMSIGRTSHVDGGAQ
jgi:hypothetical protein